MLAVGEGRVHCAGRLRHAIRRLAGLCRRGRGGALRIEHLFLESESALAEPVHGGILHLRTQGQGIIDERRQVARFLGLDKEKVFVPWTP